MKWRLRLGIFGARADQRGLAYQTQAFAKWLEPSRVLGIDMTQDDLSPYPCDWSGFSNLDVVRYSELNESSVRRWLKGLDVVLGAETFYHELFPEWARSEGARTVLQINPEFTPFFTAAGKNLPRPDRLVNPSIWRMAELPGVVHLPFPVDRETFPFRLRTSAEKFVHVAGHRAISDRAGTRMLLPVLHILRDSLAIKSQSPMGYTSPQFRFISVQEGGIDDPRCLYDDADVIVLPRRYGGLSLVAQEALSSGCPVIMLNRTPENSWGGVLPLSCRPRQNIRTKAGVIQTYETSPHLIVKAIAELRRDPAAVEKLSREADAYAQSISWDALLPCYHQVLC